MKICSKYSLVTFELMYILMHIFYVNMFQVKNILEMSSIINSQAKKSNLKQCLSLTLNPVLLLFHHDDITSTLSALEMHVIGFKNKYSGFSESRLIYEIQWDCKIIILLKNHYVISRTSKLLKINYCMLHYQA